MTNIELLMETLHEKWEPPGETTARNSTCALLHECTGHSLVYISASSSSGHTGSKQGIAHVRHVRHLRCLWILEAHGRLLLLLLLEPLLWKGLLLGEGLLLLLLLEALLREANLLLHLWRRRHLLLGLLGWLYAVT